MCARQAAREGGQATGAAWPPGINVFCFKKKNLTRLAGRLADRGGGGPVPGEGGARAGGRDGEKL